MKKQVFTLFPGSLSLADIRKLQHNNWQLQLDTACLNAIEQSAQQVESVASQSDAVYGINTGFGLLANKSIPRDKLKQLQQNLILSHATGTGALLSNNIVRLILLFKINSLARGYSGVRLQLLEHLIALFNHDVYPNIPSKGSVGASGDLAPLAHMSLALLGEATVSYNDKLIPAKKGLSKAKLKPLTLVAKEGLALINGLQVSTSIGLSALLQTERVFSAALVAGSLAIDASAASAAPLDARIHSLRNSPAQQRCARIYRDLLVDSEINQSHQQCERVQDPYSLRCQPQVMGACLQQMEFALQIFMNEANAVSDNPLIFSQQQDIISGGNFHGEAIAMAADNLALAIAEIGALSERRTALLMDKNFSGLPAFLVKDSGLNSGFMIAHVTSAALASENKSLAHPASVDSLPTSGNQEDHVSMATNASNRLLAMVENTATIVAIELIAAAQGVSLRAPLVTSPQLQAVITKIRESVDFYESDRILSGDIEAIKQHILGGEFLGFTNELM